MPEQSLGEALQEVYQTVNTELGMQDASIIFRTQTVTQSSTFGVSDVANSHSDVTVSSGLKIGRTRARDVVPGGKVELNDLKIEVPANLLTEAQLKDSELIYNSLTYELVSYAPLETLSGITVRWQVIARVKS